MKCIFICELSNESMELITEPLVFCYFPSSVNYELQWGKNSMAVQTLPSLKFEIEVINH